MAFNLLVDHDNIEPTERAKGLIYILEKAISKFSPKEIFEKNVTVRLYGGWYENNNMTRRGQDLNVEISRDFPRAMTLSDNVTTLIVNVGLALSLAIEPRIHLLNTYRKRGMPSSLSTNHPTLAGCKDVSCPIAEVHNFVRSGKCGLCNTVTPEDIFHRPEQKLVDTMLTSDMISIGQTENRFCVLSSDDDFWPGILSAIICGAVVYHMHTKGRSTPGYYSRTVSSNYFQKTL